MWDPMGRLPAPVGELLSAWERKSLRDKVLYLIGALIVAVLLLGVLGAPSWMNEILTLLVASAIGSTVLREVAHRFATMFVGRSAKTALFRPRVFGFPVDVTLTLVVFALFWLIWKLDAIGWLVRNGGSNLLSVLVVVIAIPLAIFRVRRTKSGSKR